MTDSPDVPPSSRLPSSRLPPVKYKGGDLDPARGPGLGCFWLQLIVLLVLIVATPLSVAAEWPPLVSAILLFVTLALLLVAGQTVIFLLRLVAAERREGRRRPMAGGSARSSTVGEIEDAGTAPPVSGKAEPTEPDAARQPDGPRADDAPAHGSPDRSLPGDDRPMRE